MRTSFYPLAILLAFQISVLADNDSDGISVPLSSATTNQISPDVTFSPRSFDLPSSPAGDPTSPDSPSFDASFQGTGDAQYTPPDTMGAVGPNHLMIMINGMVRITDRAGGVLQTNTLNGWWNSIGPFSDTNFVFDPRVEYDPYNDRWIASAAANGGTTNSQVLLAVSTGSNPTSTWYRYKVPADSTHQYWADYPQLGFSKDKIAITYTFTDLSTDTDFASELLLYDKASMYAGHAFASTNFSSTYLDSGAFGFFQIPAITYDNTITNIYLVQRLAYNQSGIGYLAVYQVTGTAASATIKTNGFPQASAWSQTGGVNNFGPQKGTTQKVDTGDDRMHQPVYRNGALWCTHTIFLPAGTPTHSAIQWWQLVPATGAVTQRGIIQDTTAKTNYAYPSIAVNKFKDIMVGFSSFAATQYVSANYAFHSAIDAVGTMQTPQLLKAGISSYWRTNTSGTDNRNRWGDYSATMVDPLNDIDLWTIQEYAEQYSGTLTNRSGRYGTWWGELIMLLPGNDNFSNAYAISGGQGSTNGTVQRATRETGEPSHGGNTNTPSVWYNWTAPASGTVTLNASNLTGSFSMVIAVYTGTNVSSLTLKTNNVATLPKVTFNATSNTTYRIAVAGNSGAIGDFKLSWLQPVVPIFLLTPSNTNMAVGETLTMNW